MKAGVRVNFFSAPVDSGRAQILEWMLVLGPSLLTLTRPSPICSGAPGATAAGKAAMPGFSGFVAPSKTNSVPVCTNAVAALSGFDMIAKTR